MSPDVSPWPVLAVAPHAAAAVALALLWFLGRECPPERLVVGLSKVASVAALLASLALLPALPGREALVSGTVDAFRVGDHAFALELVADRLSVPLVVLGAVLVALVSAFSARYLHREPGFFRFYLLLHVFAAGATTLFLAGSLDVVLIGWELMGITSAWLIAFFEDRPGPARSALRVFATYRVADLGLLVGMVALVHVAGTTRFSALALASPTSGAAAVSGLLLVLAAAGKSAQVPFSGWLLRAMEGPTPSSAIFYGALSVHAGAYLLLRTRPWLAHAPAVLAVIVALGLVTAVVATASGRAATDGKAQIAWASLAQVGLVFAEVGAGWTTLALIHLLGNAALRTLQFLRAPSLLRDVTAQHAALGGLLPRTGTHLDRLVPEAVERRLYAAAVERFHLDALVDRVIVLPVARLAALLRAVDDGLIGAFEPGPGAPALAEAASPAPGREEVHHV
jgi:NADH-quinone oxidoreductase subunit L